MGAPASRQARWEGKGPFPAPRLLEAATEIEIPSRESGRNIPCRLVYPTARKTEEERKGLSVLCHIHGGGWVVSPSLSLSWFGCRAVRQIK